MHVISLQALRVRNGYNSLLEIEKTVGDPGIPTNPFPSLLLLNTNREILKNGIIPLKNWKIMGGLLQQPVSVVLPGLLSPPRPASPQWSDMA